MEIGLCCYGCLFSWKLVFQEQGESFELVLSASSASEERAWKTEALKATASLADATRPPAEPRRYSFSSFDLTALDRAGRSGSLGRRSSMHSLCTSRVKPDLQHVIIKKTHCPNRVENLTPPVNGEIERPKAPYPQAGVILTTRRHDRIRLERFISDVYTRDVLPFPGMALGRGDILLRPGAIMRRFSLRPGFGRRSTSLSSPNRSVAADRPMDEPNGTAGGGPKQEDEVSVDGMQFEQKEAPKDDSPVGLARGKTVRLRQITKQISKSDFWSVGEGKETAHGSAEPGYWKGPLLQTIFNTLGRMRRSRPGMGEEAAAGRA